MVNITLAHCLFVNGRTTIVSVTEKARELDHLASFYETTNTAGFTDFNPEEREQSFDL